MASRLRRVDLVLQHFIWSLRTARRAPAAGRRRGQPACDDHLAALVVRVEVGRGERAREDLVVFVAEAHVAQNGTAHLDRLFGRQFLSLNQGYYILDYRYEFSFSELIRKNYGCPSLQTRE